MLHGIQSLSESKKAKQARETVAAESGYDQMRILKLLLDISQIEQKVKELIQKLLGEKREKWNACKTDAHSRILELAEVFGGNQPLTRVEKNG